MAEKFAVGLLVMAFCILCKSSLHIPAGVACIGSGRLSNSIVHHLVEVDELRPMCSFMAASLGQITCGIVDAAKLAEHDRKSISLADELTRT